MSVKLRRIVVVLGATLELLGSAEECTSASQQRLHHCRSLKSSVSTTCSTTGPEHVLLQLTGQLSRLNLPELYDGGAAVAIGGAAAAATSAAAKSYRTSEEATAAGQPVAYSTGLLTGDWKALQPYEALSRGALSQEADALIRETLSQEADLGLHPFPDSLQGGLAPVSNILESSFVADELHDVPMASSQIEGFALQAAPAFRQAPSTLSCGFAANEGPVCGKMVRHSCKNASWLAQDCPSSCDSVLPDPLFSCAVACVAKGDCKKLGGRTMGFYDPVTKQCGPGPIEGCLRHDGPNVCDKCSSLFRRTEDGGTCEFMPGYQEFAIGVLVVVVILLLILLPVNCYRWCYKRIGNANALNIGWRHRACSLASMTKYEDPTRLPEAHSLQTNMHTELVAGAGLCLFYNALQFLFVVTVLVAIVTTLIWNSSTIPNMGYHGKCALQNDKGFEKAVEEFVDYQRACAIFYGFLWMGLFAASLYWAKLQHLAFRKLDADTSLMSDFGLCVSGLPRDAEQDEIAEFFSHLISDGIVGVSVAYDYRKHTGLVAQMLDRHVHAAEHRHASMGFGNVGELEAFPRAQDATASQHYQEALSIIRRMQGSGKAFVVCRTEFHREQLYKKWKDLRPKFRGTEQIKLDSVNEEPCCFFWENFGYDQRSQIWRGFREMVVLLIEIIILGLVVYWPAAYYIFYRLLTTGNDSTDPVVMILGFGISIMNSIMCVLVDISSRRIGFHHKVDVDICNLIGCTMIVGMQTFFNLAVAYFAVKSVDVSMASSLFVNQHYAEQTARHSSAQVFMAAKLWNLLVPGVLVIPDLIFRLFTYVLSWKARFNYWVYIPFLKPDLLTDETLTTHEAEEKLLPAPIQTEFDYSNNICVTSTAFLMLFFHSEYTHLTAWILVLWVCVTYLSLKYCHLRLCSVVEYTSSHLEDCYAYLWGIPVSILAAASAYWITKLNDLAWWVTAVAFGASLLAYLISVHIILKSVSTDDDGGRTEYSSARTILRYDYFNTNPILVVKSHYLREGKLLPNYFVRGKEYLQQSQKSTPYGLSKLWAYEKDVDSDSDSILQGGCCALLQPSLGSSLKPSALNSGIARSQKWDSNANELKYTWNRS